MEEDTKLSIREAGRITGVPEHTLRFWEKQLPGLLTPDRTPGGQRRYGPKHLEVIGGIKRLRTQGVALDLIERTLNDPQLPSRLPQCMEPDVVTVLADRVAQAVRAEIYSFFRKMQSGDSGSDEL
jgi:DNA-binding transcriptional MerR regulator